MIYLKDINNYIKIFSLLIIINISINAQSTEGYYRLYLRDKNYNDYNTNRPDEFLSQKSIHRRLKYNIPIDEKDLPISNYYIDSLKKLGLEILAMSKWMNTMVVGPVNDSMMNILKNISFIKEVRKVAPLNIQKLKKAYRT